MVSQLTKLLCCLTSDLFARTLFAASFYRGTDVFQWSSMRPPCWRNSAFATYSSTSVFGTVAHSEESWQVLKDLLVRYRLGGSSDDCLSEEKTGLSLKSQDPVSPVGVNSTAAPVCGPWTLNDSHVVCRQVGLGNAEGFDTYTLSSPTKTEAWVKRFKCKGGETCLQECGQLIYSLQSCTQKEISVRCSGPDKARICMDKCSVGFTKEGNEFCIKCPATCLKCQATHSVTCLECKPGYYKTSSGGCVKHCPKGTYNDTGTMTCIKCNSQCLQCLGRADTCTNCSPGKFITQSGSCVSSCGSGFVVQSSSIPILTLMGENLPLSYFKSGKDGFLPFCSMDLMVGNVVCKQMGFDGALSSDINVGVNNWTSCWSLRDVKCSGSEDRLSDCYGYSTLRTTRILKDIRSDIKLSRLVCMGTSSVRRCVEICPDGFYGLQGKCKLCAVNCKTCTKSPLHCSSCRFPLYLKKNRCVKTCGSGYYGNVLSRNCTSCEGGCLTCVDGATGQFCISCKNGYILHGSECRKSSPTSAVYVKDIMRMKMGKPKIRLAGSREGNDYEGRVEAFREGIWGTICLSFTDMDLVDRICQELGFVSGTGKIWLEDPRCANNPWSLSDCNFYGWGHTSCDHSKDLYVVCKNERLAPDYYDFYRDLNPKPCLSYAACSHYSKCVKVVTEGAHQHSMCLHCREGTIGNGKKCTAIANDKIEKFGFTLKNMTVDDGEYVKLICRVSMEEDKSVFEIKWFRNDISIWDKQSSDNLPGLTVSGSTGSELQFQATSNGTGKYSCKLFTTAGVVDSTAYLTVRGKPIITRVSSSDNAKVGFSALLTCEADGENVTWSWYHNGKNISGNRFQPSPIGGSLSIKSLQLSDIGTYKCVASNRLGNEEAPLQLSISGPIKFVSNQMDVRAKKGNDVKLDCSVTLSTYVRYTWKKWGKPLPVNNRFFSMSNGMLVIKRVGPYDQGVYTCAVSTNSLIVSRRITVLVEGSPKIYRIPESITAIDSATIILRCRAVGVPPLTYSWIKDGLSVTSGPRKVLLDNGATLKLLDVRVVDSGIYTCRASNNFGKDQREAELKVIKYDLQTGSPEKTKIPTFNDTLFQSVFIPIVLVLCVIIIGTLIVKFRNRRKRKLLRASAAGADRHGDDLNVTYHASPLLNEGDYDDESLEVIKYDTNPRIDGDRLQLMVKEDDDDVTSKR